MANVERPVLKKNLERLLSSPSESNRVFFVHDRRRVQTHRVHHHVAPYPTNIVRTSKYTALTFLPCILLEQFRRVANVFFLAIAVLQLTTSLSPTHPSSTVLPLGVVLVITLVREAVDDYKRHVADTAVNRSTTHRLVDTTFVPVAWQSLEVGDIVRVNDGEDLPADLLLMVSGGSSTSDDTSIESAQSAFVETSSLDGACLPKRKLCLEGPSTSIAPSIALETFHGWQISCDPPNPALDRMTGSVVNVSSESSKDTETMFTIDNVLLRGTTLRHTKWVVGIVLAAGHDTKLLQTFRRPMANVSQIDRVANRYICVMIGLLLIVVTASTAAGEDFMQPHKAVRAPFVGDVGSGATMEFATLWITYLILYSHLVPISLYSTLELVKWLQTKQIERDRSLRCPMTARPACAMTSNLNEHLGLVNFIFADKTGTLTANEMVLRKTSIAGMIVDHSAPSPHLPNTAASRTFVRCVLLCHSATHQGEQLDASCPDEMAMLVGFARLNCRFRRRLPHSNVVDIFIFGDVETYSVLATIPFDSVRRCMSVLVQRDGEDAAIVFFKGADSALMPLAPPDDTTKAIAHNVHEFASSGLRTLVFASRTVDGMDVASLTDAAKRRASGDCPDSGRDVLVRGLEGGTPISILGATGVEDRLQSGVADCLSMLFRAGMRIWMVTGDKDETAVAVGHSCGLLTTHSNPRPDETPNGPLQQQHVLSVDGTTADECLDQITQHRRALKKQGLWNPATVIPTIAIVLNGFALEAILSAPNEIPTGHLMDLIVQARSVIACRLSPVQKASLVELVKLHHPRNVTLAIGDGGNDVPMIHTAHIGVGLYGNAGLLAARASDVAIARFQLLLRLLLLHGRWNHRRIMHVVLFTLYKGIALTTTLGLFSFFTGFSGQSLFDSYLIVGWTVVYTLAPVLVVGVVDQDITAPTILAYPAIYQEMEPINARKVLLWVASAALHSSIILYTVAKSIRSSALEAGGVVYVGTVVFAAHLLAATVKAAMTMHRWHRWQPVHVASLMLGPVLFVLFVAIFSHRYGPWPGLHVARDIAGVGEVMVSDAPTLFLVVFVVVPASVLPDVAFFGFQRLYFYSNRHVLQEIDSCLGSTRPRRSGTKTQAVAPCPDTPAPIVLAPDTPATASTSSNWPASPFPPPEEAPMPSQPVVAPPSECAILIALLQRLHATHRADPEDNVLAATDTKMHPTKMEFVGKQRVALEREFDASAVHHELRRVRVYVYVAACLMLVSLLVEYFVTSVAAHPDTQQLPLGRVDAPAHVASVRQAVAPTQGRFMTPFLVSRLTIVVLALAYAQATRTSMFAKHYHVAILVPMAVTGVVISATITVTGYVSAVLFPIVVLTMLHVRFTAALIVVLVNFAIYLVLQVFGDDSVLSATELGAFTCYIALVVGLAAHGCWRMQYAMRVDFLQHRALAMEEFRAVHILRNMFPPHVMAKLKAGDAIISEEEPDVTVLFCDIVDLHAFMRDHAPAEVVALLDHIYSLFDEMCVRFGVQKMETVGKTYMACAGMQSGGVGGQMAALRAASLAQEMIRLMATCRTPRGTTIPLRIGLNSGRVLSGLVGRKKQQFSLFGDTVNTASRMQSTGVVGAVQVSEATHHHLKASFSFESRQVEVKGKGSMTTYLLGAPMSDILRELVRPRRDQPPPSNGTGTDRHDVAMKANVHWLWLHFVQDGMEAAYIKSTAVARDTAATYTTYALGLYMGFALVRDIVLGFNDARISTAILAFGILSRAAMVVFTAGMFRWRPASVLARPCVVASAAMVTMAVYHILAVQTCGVDKQGDMLALDIALVMFAVSNSGAVVHRTAIWYNLVMWIVSVLVFVLSYRCDNSSESMHPIILTSCTAIANVTISRRIEFFNRRVLWLQRRTQLETKKADELLYQRLPEAVVHRMKRGEVVCDEHLMVGILYSDIKGYTSIASKANTEQVIHMLDAIFAAFDALTEKHNVFKLQTIGDAYVVVSGLPYVDATVPVVEAGKDGIPKLLRQDTNPDAAIQEIEQLDQARKRTTKTPCVRVDQHLQNLVHLALDMIHQVSKVHDPNTNEPLQMRIGIHLGSIYGGVIGNTTLRYDMWGPDALTANEVESNGVPGKVVVTAAVKAELDELGIQCHYHCDIKPNIQTYVVQLEPGQDLARSDSPRRATSAVGSGGNSPAKLRKSY